MNSEFIPHKEQLQKSVVHVLIEKGDSPKKEYFFKDTFRIGRENTCAVQIVHGLVSRDHIEISLKKGEWWIADLFSSNGTFVNGNKVDHIKLSDSIKLELGNNGPIICLELISETDSKGMVRSEVQGSLTTYIKRYFNADTDNPNIGDHTRMIQQAFKIVKKRQSKKYLKIIIGVLVIAIAAATYSIYNHIRRNELVKLAEDLFYSIKETELEINNLIDSININKEKQRQLIDKRKNDEKKYDQFIESLGLYSSDREEQLIQKIARRFGECEINIPKEFSDTVKQYIKLWQWRIGKGNKYEQAIDRANKNNYTKTVVEYFLKRGLRPEFFYLALQESEFKKESVGPITSWGYAKGIWQFIAATAEEYDLRVGPLKEEKIFDPEDERFDFLKATDAAARYIKFIFSTEAQASGLLVMASYNWGERRVIRYLKKLTDSTNYVEETVKYIKELNKKPKDRNFWKLITTYRDKVPKQTYDYVFYIFSAAVIGEDPEYFGFGFKNPLKDIIEEVELNSMK